MTYGYGYGYPGGQEYAFHPLFSLIWIVVAVIVIVMLVRMLRRGGHWRHMHHHHGGALEMLRERYAKGEISTAEFEERKKALEAE